MDKAIESPANPDYTLTKKQMGTHHAVAAAMQNSPSTQQQSKAEHTRVKEKGLADRGEGLADRSEGDDNRGERERAHRQG
ncbi:hypothetical protein ACLOJK_008874 [Asimina triloba]